MENHLDRYEPGRNQNVNINKRSVLTPERFITHENCADVEKSVLAAVEEGKTEVILDCKNVELLDSAALELLFRVHHELRSKRGSLKIIGLNAVCQDILMATRMNNALLVYRDIHEAIRNIS